MPVICSAAGQQSGGGGRGWGTIPANITVLAQYWPNTVGGTGPLPQASTGPVQFCTPYLYWPGTVLQYWPGIGPVLAQYHISGIGPVPAQYWNSFSVLAQYRPNTVQCWPSIGPILHIRNWPSTDPIPGQYRFVCTGPVLNQYYISSIGPVSA